MWTQYYSEWLTRVGHSGIFNEQGGLVLLRDGILLLEPLVLRLPRVTKCLYVKCDGVAFDDINACSRLTLYSWSSCTSGKNNPSKINLTEQTRWENDRFRYPGSRVAQWERAGPITQRSMDRNHPLL